MLAKVSYFAMQKTLDIVSEVRGEDVLNILTANVCWHKSRKLYMHNGCVKLVAEPADGLIKQCLLLSSPYQILYFDLSIPAVLDIVFTMWLATG